MLKFTPESVSPGGVGKKVKLVGDGTIPPNVTVWRFVTAASKAAWLV
jgi:hypothetical protein